MPQACSLLAHATDIDDLLEGLDGVLEDGLDRLHDTCLLYTSPSPRDRQKSRMPSSA